MMYSGLDELLASDKNARTYFAGLPDTTQTALISCCGAINSADELFRFPSV
ncbi:MAG TPA: hypothetical protein IAA60_06945 [Candidatus Ornithomonoglobus intestinigallinarum]|uniref:Uncharacterized protein n=1 Tax=Candidatus Ornithomonoglobus intestinigallinarum TaxID=2840894 RepID=A0A9D1KPI5_9FIRM|nr:hypothetical protein [Candidatus Ornithomonoglobus intestinigallinarum]